MRLVGKWGKVDRERIMLDCHTQSVDESEADVEEDYFRTDLTLRTRA